MCIRREKTVVYERRLGQSTHHVCLRLCFCKVVFAKSLIAILFGLAHFFTSCLSTYTAGGKHCVQVEAAEAVQTSSEEEEAWFMNVPLTVSSVCHVTFHCQYVIFDSSSS